MAPGVGVTPPRGGAARDVARQFVAENLDLFGLDGEDVQSLRVGRESRSAAGFPQAYDVLVDATSGRILYRWTFLFFATNFGGNGILLDVVRPPG